MREYPGGILTVTLTVEDASVPTSGKDSAVIKPSVSLLTVTVIVVPTGIF